MAKVFQKPLCLLRRILPVAIVIAISEVTSFSIGGSAARQSADLSDTDLFDALSVLQRERRRVGGDFVFGEQPRYLPADVDGWLGASRHDQMPVDEYDFGQIFGGEAPRQPWVSDGEFKGFDTRPSVVMPTKEEVEDLFTDDDDDGDDSNNPSNTGLAMKKKKSAKRLVKKSGTSNMKRKAAQFDTSYSSAPVSLPLSLSPTSSASLLQPTVDDENVSLDLTQEEFRALMKAVRKLQKQVKAKPGPGLTVVEKEVITSEPGEQMAIVQPASKEELASLFATEDDDEDGDETEVSPGSSSILNPADGLVVAEAEETEETPEGARRVLEVQTPGGGRKVTELVAPDGKKDIVEEVIPEGRVSIKDIEEVLEDSEKELSDALASQLEKDISEEVAEEELEAEEQAAEEEAEQAAEFIAVQQQRDKAVAAAKHEIAREIGVDNLEALEKMWMTDNSAPNGGMRLTPEKRTTKRAAYKPRSKAVSPDDFSDFELPDIMDDTGFRVIDDDSDPGDVDREAEEVARALLKEQTLQDAMNAIGNLNSGNEDIIYGSPLTGDEFVADENVGQERPEKRTISSSRSQQITKERLQELAEKLNLNEESFDEDSVESFPSAQDEDDEDGELSNDASDGGFPFDDLGDEDVPMFETAPAYPPPLDQFVARIAELEDKVKQLRLVAGLADFENDVLTDALNEATLAQEPGTVSDLEFNSLQEAIRVERELQKLKQAGALNTEDDDSFGLQPENGLEKKRSGKKRGEPWRRKRGKITSGPSRSTSTALQPGRSWVSKAHWPKPVSRDDVVRLLSETQYGQGSQHSIASIFLSDAEECPAVEMYSTNCELADLYSLPVDYEARALCNLHEMCYACGHSLGVSQSTCDEVYRATADTLCEHGQACSLEAEIFLRTMKLKTRYVPHTQPSCRSTCTATFLGII